MDEQGNQTLTVGKEPGAATGADIDAGTDTRQTNRVPSDSNETNNADESAIIGPNSIPSSNLDGETNGVKAEHTDATTIGDIAGGVTSGGMKDGGTGTGTSGGGQIENARQPD